jgi:hypothetical protein
MKKQIQDFRKRWAQGRSKGMAPDTEHKLHRAATPPDVESPRQKSQRHGKVTADRWNQ